MYDISTWKTKELDNLSIPMASLFKPDRIAWKPTKSRYDNGSFLFLFELAGKCYIKGTIDTAYADKGAILRVSDIHVSGECSGTVLRWVIEPALVDSRGKLVASLVWEGGHSIDRLTVIDGVVSLRKIEI